MARVGNTTTLLSNNQCASAMLSEEHDIKAGLKEQDIKLDWESLRAKSLQPRGFGDDRVKIWPRLLNAKVKKEVLCGPLKDEEPQAHHDERQIGLDTDRSFVLYPVDEQYDKEALQAGLHQLLVSLFRKRPRLSYFQGYHDIVTVLFLTLPSELHLSSVEKLSLHRVRDSMGSGLEPVLGLLRVTQNVLRLADPEYANILQQTSPLPFYALSNLLTLFSHDMPTLPLIQHVFDYLLCRPPIAAVYLAASIILSRKAEALHLEEEGEEGMIHSLLSSLPNLADDDEMVPLDDDASSEWKEEESSAAADNSCFKSEATVPEVLAPSPELKIEDEEPNLGEVTVATESANSPLRLVNDHDPPDPGTDSLSPDDSPLPAEEYPSKPDNDEVKTPRSAVDVPELSEQTDTPFVLNPVKLEDDGAPFPPFAPHPKPPKIVLTELLQRADELYSEFPPTHPALALSSIMGPQSVVFTWSESPVSLPSDNTAEGMVSHPELIVYPFVEPQETKEALDTKLRKEAGKSLRKHRRLGKSPFGRMEKKTVLAGAVIVVGVAVAVYGIRTHANPGAHGHGYGVLFGEGHGNAGGRDWKRLKGLVGGVLAGMSTKFLNGLSSGP